MANQEMSKTRFVKRNKQQIKKWQKNICQNINVKFNIYQMQKMSNSIIRKDQIKMLLTRMSHRFVSHLTREKSHVKSKRKVISQRYQKNQATIMTQNKVKAALVNPTTLWLNYKNTFHPALKNQRAKT